MHETLPGAPAVPPWRYSSWEGGGEYNVARGLRRCFGMRTAIVTAFADNAVGRLVEYFILQGGVDVSFVKWTPFDGIGRTVRNGLNFTERGHGIRGALGVSDRGNTAVSQIVMCDDRGNIRAAGGNSAARLFTATPLGRATILRDETQIENSLTTMDKSCP